MLMLLLLQTLKPCPKSRPVLACDIHPNSPHPSPLNSSHFLLASQIAYDKLRQQVRMIQQDRESELNLMRHRINDLTGKLRLAKHCMSRSQDRRRGGPVPVSEAGRHKLSSSPSELPKDFGGKLQDLEQRIGTIQLLMNNYDGEQTESAAKPQPDSHDGLTCRSPTCSRPKGPALSRRLSHDSDCSDSHSMLLRLHELSASVRKISDSLILYCDNAKPAASYSSSSSPSSSSCVTDIQPTDSELQQTRI